MPIPKPLPADIQHIESVSQLLSIWAALKPDSPAYSFIKSVPAEITGLTYRELDERVNHVAAWLAIRTRLGDRVILALPPGLEFVQAFLGCLRAGCVAVPICPPSPSRAAVPQDSVIADSRSSLGITMRVTREILTGDTKRCPAACELPWACFDEFDFDADLEAPAWAEPSQSPGDLAVLQYTSGSTGKPKGVMLTHRNIMANSRVIGECFQYHSESNGLSWLPPYHDMGLIGGVIQPLLAGFHIRLMSPLHVLQQPLRWLQAISSERITISGGPNFIFESCLLRVPESALKDLDLSCLDVMFCGAEPIHAETLRSFARRFSVCGFKESAFLPCYGLAESTLMVTGKRHRTGLTICRGIADSTSEVVSCGQSFQKHQTRIVDPLRKTELPEGEVGEIWTSGPSVSSGYWQQPDATIRRFGQRLPGDTNRYLRTGDLGFVMCGELYLRGRQDDLIIIRGVNHYPSDIEDTVVNASSVLATGGCVAFPDPGDKSALVIVAELTRTAYREWKSRDCIEAETRLIQLAVREAVTRTHRLKASVVLLVRPREVPKTTSGKVRRQLCRERYCAGEWPHREAEAGPDAEEMGRHD